MLWKDLRYAARTMRRSPVFALAVIFTVALAIAANTVIFSVVNAVLLRPLPFAQPDRIMQVAEKNDRLNLPIFASSILNFVSWREQTQLFEELGGLGTNNYTLSGNGEPEQLTGNNISPALTRVFGLAPVAGRAFTEDEEKPGAAPVAMISEGLWKRRFGGDRSLVGRVLTLNGVPTTVVGIAPAAFSLIGQADVYTPLTINLDNQNRLNHIIVVFGRLKPGVTLGKAQAEMNTISARINQQYPEVRDWGIHVLSLFDAFVSPELKTGLIVLLCAVASVLLIACANIANLLLTRAAAREREMAVRTAIGASRLQLVRQALAESVMLSTAGGVLGLLAALSAMRSINRLIPQNVLPVPEIQIDSTVLLFAIGLTVVTGLLFGIAPAWRMAGLNLHDVLKQGGRGSAGGLHPHVRNGLAALETAMATILLIGAGLLIQSLVNLQRVRLGFNPDNLITFQLSPPPAQYPATTKAPQLYQALVESLESVPGVRGAAVSSGIPFGAGNYTLSPFIADGPSLLPPDTPVGISWRTVTPGYFRTMEIPLVRGRDFTAADSADVPAVILVSQSTARKYWGDTDPIGRTLHRTAGAVRLFTVVGVVGDVRDTALNQQSLTLYLPTSQRVFPLMDVVVRAERDGEALLPSLREKVHQLDPDLALANVRTMDQWLATSAAQPRLSALLLCGFAAMALLIAAVGIYGVLAYSVAQQTREIGVRIALGAQPSGVLRLVVGQGMRVACIGIGAGLLGGFALGRGVAALVYGVKVHDPVTFAGVAVVLTAVALAACAIPARRAARVDPLVALRFE
jgi:putative ABC transport system permease protein